MIFQVLCVKAELPLLAQPRHRTPRTPTRGIGHRDLAIGSNSAADCPDVRAKTSSFAIATLDNRQRHGHLRTFWTAVPPASASTPTEAIARARLRENLMAR